MLEYKEILINRQIEKSDEMLEVAEYALSTNKLTTALNRLYYAIFYTVTALARKHDYVTKKHTQLRGWFNRKCVYEDKIFDFRLKEIYSKIYELRQENDYDFDAVLPTVDEVKDLVSEAKEFIETVRKEIFIM